MSFGKGVSELPKGRGSPNEELVAATTMKHRQRHRLTLARGEDSGQRSIDRL